VLKALVKWTLDKFLPYGPWGLFTLSFAESSFFPVPPDVLLIALALLNPKDSFFLAAITTAGSVLGAMFGYFIGLKGGRPILRKFVSEDKIATIHNYFDKYEAWAVGIAGFTPIPYKVFTIAGGVFYINFLRFVLVSILARGARFFMVGTVIYFFGDIARTYISKYFNLITIAFVVLLVLGFYAAKFILKRKKHETHG